MPTYLVQHFWPTRPSLDTGWAKSADESDAPDQWDSLVGAWAPFLGVQGSQLMDLSGSGNHGVLSGFTFPGAWIADDLGPTNAYDGVGTIVTIPNVPILQTSGSMTVMGWMWKTSLGTHACLSKGGPSGGRGWQIFTFNDGSGEHFIFEVAIDASTTCQRQGTTGYVISRWYHVAGVYNAPALTLDIYLNGMPDNGTLIGTVPASQLNTINVIEFARKPGNATQMMAGRLNDVRIYNRAVSPGEIRAIAHDPLALYRLRPRHFGVTLTVVDTTVTAIPPDAILASTNLTGAVGDIDESPSSPDASWLTATDATAVTDLRVSFGTPPANPYGSQNCRVWVRKTAGAGTPPTLTAELRQGNVLRKTCFTGRSITSLSGEVHQADWDASDLVSVLTGADVELRLVSVPGNALTTGALPAFNAVGTLLNNVTLAQPAGIDVNVPAHTAGDLLVLTVLLRNTNDNQVLTGINTGGWTQLGGAGTAYGPAASNAKLGVGWKIGDGAETVVNITTAGGATQDLLLARVHRFTATNGFAAAAVANVSTETAGTSTTLSLPTVNPGGATNRLAVTAYAASVSTTAAAPTGESGGDWTEPTAESATTNGTIGIMVSNQSGGGSVSGGSFAITSADWVAVGFTLEPALVVGAAVSTVEIGAIEWNARYLTPAAVVDLAATISGSGSLTAALSRAVGLAAPVSLSSTLSDGFPVARALTSTLAALNALAAALNIQGTVDLTGTLSATTTLTAAIGLAKTLSATLTATSTLSSDAAVGRGLTSALSSTGSLSPALTVTAGGQVALAALLSASGTLSSGLAIARALEGFIDVLQLLLATLGKTQSFTGTIAATTTLTSALQRAAELLSTVVGASTLTGPETVARNLASVLAGTATLTGQEAVVRALSSLLTETGSLSSDLTVTPGGQVTLAGLLSASGTLNATLTSLRGLDAPMIASGTLTAALARLRGLDASMIASGTLTAQATITRALQGLISELGTLSTALTVTGAIQLVTVLSAQGTLSASLSTPAHLATTLAAQAQLTANLQVLGALVTTPRIVFIGPSAPAALRSTLDILTWDGAAVHAALTSAARPLLWDGETALAALASTVDILTWEGTPAHAALTSVARGGG